VNDAKQQNPQNFSNYVVSFLDLLGQTDKLLATPLLVPSPSETEEFEKFKAGLINTFVPTTLIQQDFESAFNPAPESPEEQAAPEEIQKGFRQFKENRVKFQRFSDGHTAYLNLCGEEEFGRSYNISRIITGCCFVMISSLSREHPIRGGISIGWGVEFESNFYGAVIARAHHLESHVACYPRVVVDKQVVEYLQETVHDPNTTSLRIKGDKSMAKLALSHICQDSYDGHWIIDYLCPEHLAIYKENDAMDLIFNAYSFVKKEKLSYSANGSLTDTKLAMRYAMLDHYFTQRLTQAGVLT